MAKFFGFLTIVFLVLIFVCGYKQDYDTIGIVGPLFFICLFLTIIFTIIAAVRATAKAAKEVADFVGDLIEAVVSGVIDFFTIQDQVKQKVPNAFKIKILEKKQTAVNVGIFNKNNQPLQQIHIESNDGVSDELRAGQEYYI